eukprot:gene27759-34276_t
MSHAIETSDTETRGYTLLSEERKHWTDLIDAQGQVKHRWFHKNAASKVVILLSDGRLLRSAYLPKKGDIAEETYDVAGLVEEVDWDSNVVKSCIYRDESRSTHHDLVALPNGHYLAAVWQSVPWSRCREAGWDDTRGFGKAVRERTKGGKNGNTEGGLCVIDGIVELRAHKSSAESCEAVWEWWSIDHLVQDRNPSGDNYGQPIENPQLIDPNYAIDYNPSLLQLNPGKPQMLHINSLDYIADLDQGELLVLRVVGDAAEGGVKGELQ